MVTVMGLYNRVDAWLRGLSQGKYAASWVSQAASAYSSLASF